MSGKLYVCKISKFKGNDYFLKVVEDDSSIKNDPPFVVFCSKDGETFDLAASVEYTEPGYKQYLQVGPFDNMCQVEKFIEVQKEMYKRMNKTLTLA